jgi:Trk K+ transport system NAD-binding subunit
MLPLTHPCEGSTVDQPVILCGLGRVGRRVLEHLQAADIPVVVVDNCCAPDDALLGQARLVRGDCRRREVLQEAGVVGARGVLILTSDDLVNISTALMVRQLDAGVRVVLRMFNQNLIARLGKAVHNVYALSTSVLTAPLLALTALTGQALGAFRLDDGPDGRREVAEAVIAAGSPLVGRAVAEVAAAHQAAVLAHVPAAAPPRLLLEVAPEARLGAGDRLVVCGEPRHVAALLGRGDDLDPSVRWANPLRRNWRAFWRTVSEVDLAVKVCTGVLLFVIAASTLTLHLGWDRDSPVDAFFRTISLMATGADMHEKDYHSAWLKVFVSVLRVAGAALTAAFTAIVTNYLLRARLGGALEVRRIPDGGHVIVCGLGNVGYRVVEELLAYGERVVVIELARDARFVATTRRLGVPVIVGDATVREVLRQAHSPTARAVITATSSDLVNLEVALLVRDLNPEQRVVVRLTDPNLAASLRESADIRFALSIPVLAAPAFVAGLFGDRVLTVCLVAGHLLAVLTLRVGPQDASLIGSTVRAVAVNYRLLPVALTAADGTRRPRPLDVRLAPGDQLVAILALSDIERVLRRQPVAADCAVDVIGFPLPTRGWVAQLLRLRTGASAEEAEKALDRLPVCLGSGLTRGDAEDLLTQLAKERVTARLRRL